MEVFPGLGTFCEFSALGFIDPGPPRGGLSSVFLCCVMCYKKEIAYRRTSPPQRMRLFLLFCSVLCPETLTF